MHGQVIRFVLTLKIARSRWLLPSPFSRACRARRARGRGGQQTTARVAVSETTATGHRCRQLAIVAQQRPTQHAQRRFVQKSMPGPKHPRLGLPIERRRKGSACAWQGRPRPLRTPSAARRWRQASGVFKGHEATGAAIEPRHVATRVPAAVLLLSRHGNVPALRAA